MTKAERLERALHENSIREEIKLAYAIFRHNLDLCTTLQCAPCKRLKTCQAWVYETDEYYILRSYNTYIAFIDKHTGICYDVLRLVFGYTATSCQHIWKFEREYKNHITRIMQYR